MPTLTDQREAVAAVQHERQACFELYEQDRRKRDEVTDQAERLAAPMESTFEYELTPDGLRSDLGEYILPIVEEGLRVAAHQAQHDPKWVFERDLRAIDVDEQRELAAMAVAERCGIRITSLSLDQSNYIAMRAIAVTLGHQLPTERPRSEDILRNRMWTDVPPAMVALSPIPDAVRVQGIDIGAYDKTREKMLVRIATPLTLPKDEHASLIERIRTTYDQSLATQLGGEWFAGRRPMTVKDAKEFIEHPDQADLLAAHMTIVDEVFNATSDKDERIKRLAVPRYNFAAALDDRMNGKKVTSLSDSGNTARAEGKSFDGDCPTAETTTAQMEKLGYRVEPSESILECVNCPFCRRPRGVKAKKKNTPKERSIECQSCFAKVNLRTGERMDNKVTRTVKKLGKLAVSAIKKKIPLAKKLIRRETLTVGGTVVEHIDPETNDSVKP